MSGRSPLIARPVQQNMSVAAEETSLFHLFEKYDLLTGLRGAGDERVASRESVMVDKGFGSQA